MVFVILGGHIEAERSGTSKRGDPKTAGKEKNLVTTTSP